MRCCIETTPPPLLITVFSSLLAEDSTLFARRRLRLSRWFFWWGVFSSSELQLRPTCCLSKQRSVQFKVLLGIIGRCACASASVCFSASLFSVHFFPQPPMLHPLHLPTLCINLLGGRDQMRCVQRFALVFPNMFAFPPRMPWGTFHRSPSASRL